MWRLKSSGKWIQERTWSGTESLASLGIPWHATQVYLISRPPLAQHALVLRVLSKDELKLVPDSGKGVGAPLKSAS